MGNHLTAPPVDYHLYDLKGFVMNHELGGQRFLRTFKGVYSDESGRIEGNIVVKAFHNSERMPLLNYEKVLEFQRDALLSGTIRQSHLNVAPWQMFQSHDRTGFAYIIRQYFASDLRARMSTRPFLTLMEKQWLAYQLLMGVAQAHAANVKHGDIKTDNVMVTSWNWVYLTDFAPFKPVLLPEDNPSDFSYYFDTNGRRNCYIAPERFYNAGSHVDRGQQLTTAMDIFSVGCVIAELFLESGSALFSLGSLLDYRRGDDRAIAELKRFENTSVRDMVLHMLQREPSKRLTAQDYLDKWTGTVFPSYFPQFHSFFGRLSHMNADEKISYLGNELPAMFAALGLSDHPVPPPLLGQSQSNISQLDVAGKETKTASNFAPGPIVSVRATSGSVSSGLRGRLPSGSTFSGTSNTTSVTDSNMQSTTEPVRGSDYTGTGSTQQLLADAAAFLEQLENPTPPSTSPPVSSAPVLKTQTAQDAPPEQKKVDIKQPAPALASEGKWAGLDAGSFVCLATAITTSLRACQGIFSKVYGLDILTEIGFQIPELQRLIRIVPFQVLFLGDDLATVRAKSLRCLTALLSSIQNIPSDEAHVFLEFVVPSLSALSADKDDGVKIALAECIGNLAESGKRFVEAAHSVDTGVETSTPSDVLEELGGYDQDMQTLFNAILALVKPFMGDGSEHVKRAFLSDIVRLCGFFGLQWTNDSLLPMLFTSLNEKSWQLRWTFYHTSVGVASFVGKLSFQSFLLPCIVTGLHDEEEFVQAKCLRSLTALCELGLLQRSAIVDSGKTAAMMLCHPNTWIRYAAISFFVTAARQMALADVSCFLLPLLRNFLRVPVSVVSEISLLEALKPHVSRKCFDGATDSKALRFPDSRQPVMDVDAITPEEKELLGFMEPLVRHAAQSMQSKLRTAEDEGQRPILPPTIPRHAIPRALSVPPGPPFNLGSLITTHIPHALNGHSFMGWKPEGILVSTLPEHKGSVNCLAVSRDNVFIASGGEDGLIKIWNAENIDRKVQSRLTYSALGGHITSLSMCENSHSIAATSSNGSVHVVRVEASHHSTGFRYSGISSLVSVNPDEGAALAVQQFDSPSERLLVYATQAGVIRGWDMRMRSEAWKVCVPADLGCVSTMSVDPQHCVLVVGTRRGYIQAWDVRFQVPFNTFRHPSSAPIMRLRYAPNVRNSIMVAAGKNELSIWDIEKTACSMMFRTVGADPSPPNVTPGPLPTPGDFAPSELPISSSGLDTLAVRSFTTAPDCAWIMTAGDDRRVRYWSLKKPNDSCVIAGSGSTQVSVSHVGSLSLFQEQPIPQAGQRPSVSLSTPSQSVGFGGPSLPQTNAPIFSHPGHFDSVTDMVALEYPQRMYATSSRDGTIKFWK